MQPKNLAPLAVLAALLAGTLPAPAQKSQPASKIDCEAASTTPELAHCANEDLKAADAILNQTYKAALASIDGASHLTTNQRRDWRRAMQETQRHWLAFRDSDCGPLIGWEWFQGTGQGTGMGAASLACKAHKTRLRTEEIAVRYLGADGTDKAARN